MRKLLVALLVAPALGASAFATDISGTWEVRFKADWTSIPVLLCTLSQNGDELTGSCRAADEPEGAKVVLTGGKVDGDKVSCQWNVVLPGGDAWTYALTGTLDARRTTMNGTFKVSGPSDGGEGSFSGAKR